MRTLMTSLPSTLRMLVPAVTLFLLLPSAAQAAQDCRYSEARALQLDLAGVKTVNFQVGKHLINVHARQGAPGSLTGKACASEQKWLAGLTVTQKRVGDRLIVTANDAKGSMFNWTDAHELRLDATIPDTLMVEMDVGSGHALVEGAARLSGDVGSGELEARNIRGTVFADVGSGDIDVDGVGALHVVSIGSGDLVANNVAGDTEVKEIGSGDFTLNGAKGSVKIGSIGSGDAQVSNINGDLKVEHVGSGDLSADRVRGSLTVASVASGSVSHKNVSGQVRIPEED